MQGCGHIALNNDFEKRRLAVGKSIDTPEPAVSSMGSANRRQRRPSDCSKGLAFLGAIPNAGSETDRVRLPPP